MASKRLVYEYESMEYIAIVFCEGTPFSLLLHEMKCCTPIVKMGKGDQY
jgi:hypothetical protein